MKKIIRKIESIIINTPDGIEEFGCPCEKCSETRGKIVNQLVELVEKSYKKGLKDKEKELTDNALDGFNPDYLPDWGNKIKSNINIPIPNEEEK